MKREAGRDVQPARGARRCEADARTSWCAAITAAPTSTSSATRTTRPRTRVHAALSRAGRPDRAGRGRRASPRSAVRRWLPFATQPGVQRRRRSTAPPTTSSKGCSSAATICATVDFETRAARTTSGRRRSTSIPGQQYRLTDVSFIGNSEGRRRRAATASWPRRRAAASAASLQSLLRRPSGVTRGQLSDDRDAIESFYRLHGFSEATVGEPGVTTREDGTLSVHVPDHRRAADADHRGDASKATRRSRPTICRSRSSTQGAAAQSAAAARRRRRAADVSTRTAATSKCRSRRASTVSADKTQASVVYAIAEGPQVERRRGDRARQHVHRPRRRAAQVGHRAGRAVQLHVACSRRNASSIASASSSASKCSRRRPARRSAIATWSSRSRKDATSRSAARSVCALGTRRRRTSPGRAATAARVHERIARRRRTSQSLRHRPLPRTGDRGRPRGAGSVPHLSRAVHQPLERAAAVADLPDRRQHAPGNARSSSAACRSRPRKVARCSDALVAALRVQDLGVREAASSATAAAGQTIRSRRSIRALLRHPDLQHHADVLLGHARRHPRSAPRLLHQRVGRVRVPAVRGRSGVPEGVRAGRVLPAGQPRARRWRCRAAWDSSSRTRACDRTSEDGRCADPAVGALHRRRRDLAPRLRARPPRRSLPRRSPHDELPPDRVQADAATPSSTPRAIASARSCRSAAARWR